MSITAIIPTRDGDDLTERCIRALLSGTRKPNRILIVSDGTASGRLRQIASERFNAAVSVPCEVIEAVGPLGFSHAVNQGLASCQASQVLVINNDCFVAPDCLRRMERTLADDALAAAVTPLLTDAGKCSVSQEYVQRIAGMKGATGDPSARDTSPEKRIHIPWTCVLVRGAALAEVGPLDATDFPSGLYADDEWNLRATQQGWHVLLDTNAVASHDNESSTFQRLNLDYNRSLTEGRTNWLKRTNVLACVLGCERKQYSSAGIESAERQRWVRHLHVNYEGVNEAVEIGDAGYVWKIQDSVTHWDIVTTALPQTPSHDQDQFYRLPRIVAARNFCLDVMRTQSEFTHLLFIDSDIDAKDSRGLERLLLQQRALIGGLIRGRGEQSHAEVWAGPKLPYHGDAFACTSGSCGYQLIARPLCERYQFSWGRSRFARRMKSEDPKFAEDVAADGWGPYVIDPSVTGEHVDNEDAPLTMQSIAEF